MENQNFSTKSHANQNNHRMFQNIPTELINRKQWVVWRQKERGGKLTKVPYNPRCPRKKASVTDFSTWGTFQEACQAAQANNKVAGIGFVFTPADPYTGVDLDKCRDKQTGQFEPWAQEIIHALDSYTELSQSGTGAHILLEGTLPPGSRRKGRIEMYESERYFCTTGQHLEGTPKTIEARESQLKDLHARIFNKPAPSNGVVAAPSGQGTTTLPDDDILRKAQRAKNGKAFQKLWQGNWEGYPSQSEGDLALCGSLAFWTGRNPEQLDRLFRRSGLFRPKWDERHYGDGVTYGQKLIEKVLDEQKEVYQPNGSAGTASNKKVVPAELAEGFLTKSGLKSPDGLCLRWHREEWLKFNGKIYTSIPGHDLRAEVMAYLQTSSVRQYAGASLVKNVLAKLRRDVHGSRIPRPAA